MIPKNIEIVGDMVSYTVSVEHYGHFTLPAFPTTGIDRKWQCSFRYNPHQSVCS